MKVKNIIEKIKFILININLKALSGYLIGLGVMIFCATVAISYANREFEIPLFPRGEPSKFIEIETITNSDVEETQITEQTEAITNVLHVINPEDLAETSPNSTQNNNEENQNQENNNGNNNNPNVQETTTAFESLSDLNSSNSNSNNNWKLSDGVYNNGEDGYAYKLARIKPEIKAISTNQNTNNAQNPKRIIEVRMDYFIIRSGGSEYLFEASGKLVTAKFETLGLEILSLRDEQGRVIFKRTSDGLYFYYNSGLARFEQFSVETFDSYALELANKGANFMYNKNYGTPQSGLKIYKDESTNKWGFKSQQDDTIKIWHAYDRAYNFNENIGVAIKTEWSEWAQLGNRLYFFNSDGVILSYSFYAPDPNDTKTNRLGFYYFDHGLTRAIVKQINARATTALSQRECLIDMNFKEFYTPKDYNIISYSNGMILLEKDGNYGFMNYHGEWVAQPIYSYAQPFYEGLAVIGVKNGKKMLIDTSGNIVANMRYDYISNCSGGIIALYEKGDGWTVLNKVRMVERK